MQLQYGSGLRLRRGFALDSFPDTGITDVIGARSRAAGGTMSEGQHTQSAIEHAVIRKVGWRCLPALLTAFIVSYLDRVNIGFAALTASKDLHMSASVFGLGAGLFFITYLIFEAPSNYILERVGGRLWLGLVMVICGLIAASMTMVKGPASFYAVRLALGAVEAGLFPGVVLYLTYWAPKAARARFLSLFALGIPLSSVIGSPISGAILSLNLGMGLKGWQWLYILEAIPAVLVGIWIWSTLTDRPEQAQWLTDEERTWLTTTIARERAGSPMGHPSLLKSLKLLADPRVIVLSLVFFGTGIPSYGMGFWIPQIVKGFGKLTFFETGLISAIPFLFGSIGMVVWGRVSDHKRERVVHTVIAATVAGLGLIACIWLTAPIPALIALSVAGAGTYGVKGPFLSSVSESFTPAEAAVGIALVSSFGNLSGLAGPWMIGVIKDATGSFPLALLTLGLWAIFGGLLMFLRPRPPEPVPQPAE